MDFRIPIGQWVETVVDWLRDNLSGLFDFITVVVRFLVDGLTDILLIIPIPAMIVVFALIGWLVRSWQMAVGTVLAFVFIIAMDLWIPTMQTLSLVLVATVVALAIAIPLGIWSARNDTVRTILKPVLDFMQTMPAFVYLIPAITFFSIGVVPGLVATVIFALPPGVRLTELGIRGVDSETVEAGPRRSCAASSCRWRRRRSWPVSTRSSCWHCRWRFSPESSARTASARSSSSRCRRSISPLAWRQASAS